MIIVPIATLVAQARALRDLLKDKKRWMQGRQAEDATGRGVVPTDPNACKFCLVGGVAHITNGNVVNHPLGLLLANTIAGARKSELGKVLDDRYLTISPDRVQGYHLYSYNDYRTHEQVMDVVNTAVAVAEGAQAAGVEV